MTVRLSDSLQGALREPGTLQILVRAAPGRALPIARAVHAELTRLGQETGIYASDPAPIPDGLSTTGAGATLTVDLARLDARHLAGLPDQLTIWATSADGGTGRADADLELAPAVGGRYRTVLEFGPVVRATLRPPPPARPIDHPADPDASAAPDRPVLSLIGAVTDWIGESAPARAGEELLFVLNGAEFPLTSAFLGAPAQSAALADVLAGGAQAVMLQSDFDTEARAAAISGGARELSPEAALTWASARPGDAGLVAAMLAQRDVVRGNADRLAWGQVAIAPDNELMLSPRWDERTAPGHIEAAGIPALIAGISIPAPSWYQILSGGHLERLGGPPAGAVQLGPRRYELTVGTPEQWLPSHPDAERVRAEAAELLAGCLLTADQQQAEFSAALGRLRGHRGPR